MAILKHKNLLLFTLLIMSAACTHTTPRYSPSATNVQQIQQITKNASVKIQDGDFSAIKEKKSIMCRAAGPVAVPENKTFTQYIKDAIFDEFKIAGIYDKNALTKLSAKLDFIDFSSGMTDGNWTIRMTFSSKTVSPFTVESVHEFSGSFIASMACQQVAQELPIATQKFILKVVSHPSFKKVIRHKVAVN